MRETIGFIGGGNMARSLAGGLIARGVPARQLVVSDPVPSQLEALSTQLGVRTTGDNIEVAREADVIILAVKPQDLRAVAASLAPTLQARSPVVISIAAGIRGSDIERWLGGVPVIRAMPNRPALQNCGVTGLYAAPSISAAARALAAEILGAVGVTVWVDDEAQMDAVTAVSGSGPAYFFLLVEMLEGAGIALGLSADVSRKLAIETAYGSGCMSRDSVDPPADLRKQVTSKGGTTEAALKHLESHDVRKLFADAVAAAAHRSREMAEQLGKS